MKTVTKISLGLVVVVILGVGGTAYYVLTNLDALVKAAIEKSGTAAVKTAVRVEAVHIDLSEGTGTMRSLSIANPPGFTAPQAFTLGEIHTRINTRALTDQKIVIDEVRITGPQLVYEMNADKQGNFNILKENLGAKSADKTTSASTERKSNEKPITLTIKHLVMQDAALHATLVPLNNKVVDLNVPRFELTNLTGTPEQISRQVLNQLVDHAKDAIQQGVAGQEVARLRGEVRQQMDERLDAEKQKLQDKLQGLFNR